MNKSISGRVTQDYKSKATDLDNVWIAPDKSIQKRPGLQRLPSNISDLPGILDVKYTKDRIHVLREAKLGSLGRFDSEVTPIETIDGVPTVNWAADPNLDAQLRDSTLFDTLVRYKGDITQDVINTTMVEVGDSNDSVTPQGLTTTFTGRFGFKLDAEISRQSELAIDKLLLILSYDRNTGNRIDSECYAIARSKEESDERITGLTMIDNPDADGRIGGINFRTSPWWTERTGTIRQLSRPVDIPTTGITKLTDLLLGKGTDPTDSDFVKGLIAENESNLATLRPQEDITFTGSPATLASFDPAYNAALDALIPQLTEFLRPNNPTNGAILDRYSEREYVTVYENIFDTPSARQAEYSGGGDNTLTFGYFLPDEIGGEAITKYFNDIDSSSNDLGLSSETIASIEGRVGSILSKNLFGLSKLPTRLYNKSSDVGFALNGLRYTLGDTLTNDHTGSNVAQVDNINERAANTLTKELLNIDLNSLPILAASAEVTAGTSDIEHTVEPLSDVIRSNSRFSAIYDYLKFSLTAGNSDTPFDVSMLPDLSITLPGSDIPNYGQHLFSIDEDTHVFYADHSGLFSKKLLIDDDETKEKYSEGIGPAYKDFGIMLYVQKYNKIVDNVPKFYRFPVKTTTAPSSSTETDRIAKTIESEIAETSRVIYLTLDLSDSRIRDIMDRVKALSFYASNSTDGLLNTILSSSGRPTIGNDLSTNIEFQDELRSADLFKRIEFGGTTYANTLNPVISLENLNKYAFPYRSASPLRLNTSNIKERPVFDSAASTLIGNFSVTIPVKTGQDDTYPNWETQDISSDVVGSEVALTEARLAQRELKARSSEIQIVRDGSPQRFTLTHNGVQVFNGFPFDTGIAAFEIVPGSRRVVNRGSGDTDEYARYYTLRGNTYTGRLRGYLRNEIDSIVRTLASGGSVTGSTILKSIHRSSTEFVAYSPATESYFSGEDRDVIINGENVHFPSQDDRNQYSLGFKDFIDSNIHAYANPNYLTASGLYDYVLRELTLEGIADTAGSSLGQRPQIFTIPNAENLSYTDTDRGGAIAGSTGLYFVSYRQEGIVISRQLNEGINTNIVNNSAMVVGGFDKTIKLNRFYEEAGGFTSDIVNEDLTLPENVKDIISLMNTHQVMIFSLANDSEYLYTLSFGGQREVRGFTRFKMPFGVKGIRQIDQNQIAALGSEGSYMMDFSNTEIMADLTGQEPELYDILITPLPIISLETEDFDVTDSVAIQSIIIGIEGSSTLEYEISSLDSDTVPQSFVRHDKADIRSDLQAGLVWINNVPANGGTIPTISFKKRDDKFIKINTINIQLGS